MEETYQLIEGSPTLRDLDAENGFLWCPFGCIERQNDPGIYDPVDGCGGTMGTVLDCDFEIDPHDIAYTMMEPVRGEWKSDRIDLYTPQDCFGFSDPFGGRTSIPRRSPKSPSR